MSLKFFAILILQIFLSTAQAKTQVGKFYEIGKTDGPQLFSQKTQIQGKPNGETSWESSIQDASGKVVMTESATLKDESILFQRVDQLQLNEGYELEASGDKMTFRTYQLKDGKREKIIEEETSKRPVDFMTGPPTRNFLKNRLAKLLAGENIKANFGVFELSRSFAFVFKKQESKDDTVIAVLMRPDNMFLKVLVDPIEMEFDTKDFEMLRFKGRTPLVTFKGSSSKPFDGEIIYSIEK